MNKTIEDITIFDVIDALKELSVTVLEEPKENKQIKVYFSGEMDSNLTDFEKQSNNLEIGVVAYDDFIGSIMLRLLRYIIDLNDDLFFIDREDSQEDNPTNVMDGLLQYLSKREKQYQASFYISDIYKRKLYFGSGTKKKLIKKNIFDVDAWTLKRIELEAHDLFDLVD